MATMINGCGITYRGAKNIIMDGDWEQFDTTKWFSLAWLPLIPLGSYRIRRIKRPDIISRIAREFFSSETIYVLAKRPTDWKQISKTWTKAALVLLPFVYCIVIGLSGNRGNVILNPRDK